jgi:hypothetical protein
VPTLHIALDEGGDLNFRPNGSKFYSFAAAWTYDPAPLASALTSLRFGLLKIGDDIPSFHATEDKQAHRDQFVQAITAHTNWNFAAIVVEKRKVNPSIRQPERFYPQFAGMVLSFVFKGCLATGTTQVVTCTDTLPVAKKRDAITKMFKQSARANLPQGCRFDIYHHPRASNKWVQTADYCCWAVYRKWEKNDDRTYQQLRARLKRAELNITDRGDGTTYY